jgi:hypothetical protein
MKKATRVIKTYCIISSDVSWRKQTCKYTAEISPEVFIFQNNFDLLNCKENVTHIAFVYVITTR